MSHKKIAILVSGSGSNMEAIARYFQGTSPETGAHQASQTVEIALVVCNKSDAPALERATRLGLRTLVLTAADQKADPDRLRRELAGMDLIVLAGYLLRIPDEVLHEHPDAVVNIHPSLLPRYGGKGMWGHHVHEAVLAAGDTESGITIHLVNEVYDSGAILFQATCPVLPDDTPDTLAQRVHSLEHHHYPRIIAHLLQTKQAAR